MFGVTYAEPVQMKEDLSQSSIAILPSHQTPAEIGSTAGQVRWLVRGSD